MRNLSESDLRTVRVGGIAVVLILVFMAGMFAFDRWEGLNKQVEQSEKKLKNIESGISDASNASKALVSVRKGASIYPDRAALNRQTARMRGQVESLPGYRALAVERLEDLPMREDEPLFRSAVSLQFSGPLPVLHQFLHGVETASPALKVERLTLATQQKNASRVEGQMTITGYAVVLEKGNRG